MSQPVSAAEPYRFEHPGFCLACEQETVFTADEPYFRNALRCPKCMSAPRNRALMRTLKTYFPQWRDLNIHECSSGRDIISRRLAHECKAYTASQFDMSVPFGTKVSTLLPCGTYQSENLEQQTFLSESFDIVITQDVFEHIQRPDLAIREVARTLRPGGATIMTVPIVRGTSPSCRRAEMVDGALVNILPPVFHGNPLGGSGSLVTVDWGFDIVPYLHHHSGLSFLMLQIDDIDLGIRAQLNEVLIGFKIPIPAV